MSSAPPPLTSATVKWKNHGVRYVRLDRKVPLPRFDEDHHTLVSNPPMSSGAESPVRRWASAEAVPALVPIAYLRARRRCRDRG